MADFTKLIEEATAAEQPIEKCRTSRDAKC